MSADWKGNLLERGRKDPVWWIETVLGDTLWEKQKEICESIASNNRLAIPASFGIGKTFLIARIALWWLYTHKPAKVVSTAPCFDDQTEILTELRGWQLFRNLTKEDKVASRVDGELQWVLPTDWMDYEVEGELLGYKSRDLDFLITPHHKCLVQLHKNGHPRNGQNFELVKAEDIYGQWDHSFNREVLWEGVDTEWTEKHYEMIGFWFGDGHAHYVPEKGSYGITITQSKHKDLVRDLMSVWDKTVKEDFRPSAKPGGLDGVNFHIYSKELSGWFIENFGRLKKDRRVPKWIKESPPEKLRAFIKGFMWADGRVAKTDQQTNALEIHFSKELAEDVLEVGMKAGYVCNMVERQFEDRETTLDAFGSTKHKSWVIKFLSEGKSKKFPGTDKKHWYKQDYSGHVYCVTVPSGVVLVRRNLSYHWSGNTSRQVKDLLWSEIRTAHAGAKFPLGGAPLQLSLTLAPDQFAVGFSTDDMNMDMFTGYHSPNMLVLFDQAGGILPNIWKAAEGLMTSQHCRWIATSNTAISEGAFADICMADRESPHGDWKIIPISAEMSPNIVAGKNIYPGIISVEWLEEKKRQWDVDDPLYRIFVKAEFVPNSQMNLIPYGQLLSAIKDEGAVDLEEGIDIGLDIARQGVDSTVWTARSGARALEMKRVTGNDLMKTVQETIEFRKFLELKYDLPVRFIKVDVIGVGAGVYDRLSELDEPVLAVNNAESAVDSEKYANTRAEMAWSFRARFERGEVAFAHLKEEEPDLFALFRSDTAATKYKITQNGRIILWSKDDIKKELGRSPDYWDSMVMAYEDPKGGVPSVEFVSSRKDKEDTKLVSDKDWQKLFGLLPPDEEDMGQEYSLG